MIVFIIVVILGIILDQVTKIIAFAYKPEGVSFIPQIIRFDYVENTGASFGIFGGNQLLLSIFTMVALVVLGVIVAKTKLSVYRTLSVGLALIISGCYGNAIDRVVRGFVIDFLHYPFLASISPNVFGFSNNVADLLLTVGLILVVIHILFLENKKKKNENSDRKDTSPE
jgi:signal peptidase II